MIRHIATDRVCRAQLTSAGYTLVFPDGTLAHAQRAELDITQDAPRTYPEALVLHNHGSTLLRDVTWTPYPVGPEHYNPYGDNGVLSGVIVHGSVTSRLFHASSTRALQPGKVERVDYAALSKMSVRDGVPTFDLCTCG